MPFPSVNLDLISICNAYGINTPPYSISALRGSKYYIKPSTISKSVPMTGSVDLGQFKGAYTSVPVVSSLVVGTPPIGYIRSPHFSFPGTSVPFAGVDYTIKYKTSFGVPSSIFIDNLLYFQAFTGTGGYDPFYTYVGIVVSGCGAKNTTAIYDTASFSYIGGELLYNTYTQTMGAIKFPIDSTGVCYFNLQLYNKNNFINNPSGYNSYYEAELTFNVTSTDVSFGTPVFRTIGTYGT